MTIGEAVISRIEMLLTENEITLNKLGTISGVTQSTLNNIVSRTSKNPTISTIKKICDGLNITVIDFFNHELFADLEQEVK